MIHSYVTRIIHPCMPWKEVLDPKAGVMLKAGIDPRLEWLVGNLQQLDGGGDLRLLGYKEGPGILTFLWAFLSNL